MHQVLTTLCSGVVAIVVGSLPFMLLGWPLGYGIGRLIERFLERRVAMRQARLVAMARRRRYLMRQTAAESA